MRTTRTRLRNPASVLFAALVLLAGCQAVPAPANGTAAVAPAALYEPSRDLGQLFHDVQMARVFPDGKTFVDARPKRDPAEIVRLYQARRSAAGFDLKVFVAEHFEAPKPIGGDYRSDLSRSMEEHIGALWPVLTRPADQPDSRSSLIPLPEPYVVPGGRFREIYYWDSYFTMQGLRESHDVSRIQHMVNNFAHLIRTVGHIPNGNRTYYLSRSQPPYFGAMVGLLLGELPDTGMALRYLDPMEREHAFWMEGADRLTPGAAHRRVVRLSNGAVLNRYWDDRPVPRPESHREDFTLAQSVPEAQRQTLYRNLRASAESGWDFSSRWMRDPGDLRTLETIDLIPVDLNSLLYTLERNIAALRRFRRTAPDSAVARRFDAAADRRRESLLAIAFDPATGYFYDVRWRTLERVTDRPTLAAAAPLYFGLATPEQGRAVAARLERDFLRDGGFVTTLIASGQQWDAPNGWPPLQWLASEGSRRYGRADVANKGMGRWLALNRNVYRLTGKMTEKYDVVDMRRPAGGGEYPNQDGFGWSNGVGLAFSAMEKAQRELPQPVRP